MSWMVLLEAIATCVALSIANNEEGAVLVVMFSNDVHSCNNARNNFTYIGHSGIVGNVEADRLAVAAFSVIRSNATTTGGQRINSNSDGQCYPDYMPILKVLHQDECETTEDGSMYGFIAVHSHKDQIIHLSGLKSMAHDEEVDMNMSSCKDEDSPQSFFVYCTKDGHKDLAPAFQGLWLTGFYHCLKAVAKNALGHHDAPTGISIMKTLAV
ncbi:hypothetical protein BC830DRAFT_1085713 [Chytriomyces sp. MP71]|nr:hypothetical protein BC830DRAFT_1085713 [Chytriomyces sp. MP71]